MTYSCCRVHICWIALHEKPPDGFNLSMSAQTSSIRSIRDHEVPQSRLGSFEI